MKFGQTRLKWMQQMGRCVVALLLCAGQAHAFTFADTPDEDSTEFLPVEQAFALTPQLQGGRVVAHFVIADGYYLYHDRLQVLDAAGRPLPLQFNQSGHTKQDPNFGPVVVHEGTLDVTTHVPAGLNQVTLGWQGCARAGLCYPPQKRVLTVAGAPASAAPVSAPLPRPPEDTTSRLLRTTSWPLLMLGFLILGLGLSFTPCVFPMVPILSAIIAGAGTRQALNARRGFLLALSYVLGMALAYTGAGALMGWFGARANVAALLQTPPVTIAFAGLFAVLALAMFGLFELRLPAAVQQRLDTASRGLPGGRHGPVFVMGLLSALVVSPCVSAPLAGVLSYIATTGDAGLGALALFSLALGMGAPLLVIGAGGGSLLPRAGAWMVGVRVLFGIVLLGLAVWLLGRVVPESVQLGLWGLLLLGSAQRIGLELSRPVWQRIVSWPLALWGALALIGAAQGHGSLFSPLQGPASSVVTAVADPAPAGGRWTTLHDPAQLAQRVAAARAPVLVDVYADWCTACQEMEHTVYARPDVQAQLAGYERIRLDITAGTSAQRAWLDSQHLFGPPALLRLEPGGRAETLRLVGQVPALAVCRQLASPTTIGRCAS